MTDEEVEQYIADRVIRQKNTDAVQELINHGVSIELRQDGTVRWRRA